MKALLRIILFLLLSGLIIWLLMHRQDVLGNLQLQLEQLNPYTAIALFLVTFTIGTLFFIPSSVFMIASGACFGLYEGYLWSMIGFTLGACACFLSSRFLLHDMTRRLLPDKIKNIINQLHQHGWKLVATLRLIGMVPASLISYALGITQIRFGVFTWASCIFTLPAGLLYTYAGVAGKDFIENGDLQRFLVTFIILMVLSIILIVLRKLYLRKKHVQP